MAGSHNRGYVKPAIDGTSALTALVPYATESKLPIPLCKRDYVKPEPTWFTALVPVTAESKYIYLSGWRQL